jgi:hypothetical protein
MSRIFEGAVYQGKLVHHRRKIDYHTERLNAIRGSELPWEWDKDTYHSFWQLYHTLAIKMGELR